MPGRERIRSDCRTAERAATFDQARPHLRRMPDASSANWQLAVDLG
jgi:hypothetical protein